MSKPVIDYSTKTIISVPDHYKECSICKIHQDPKCFQYNEDNPLTRGNCKTCYEADSPTWNGLCPKSKYDLNKELESLKDHMRCSVSVKSLIKALESLPDGSMINTVDADGDVLALILPQASTPSHTFEGINYYNI